VRNPSAATASNIINLATPMVLATRLVPKVSTIITLGQPFELSLAPSNPIAGPQGYRVFNKREYSNGNTPYLQDFVVFTSEKMCDGRWEIKN
jgi:hypothetical protein